MRKSRVGGVALGLALVAACARFDFDLLSAPSEPGQAGALGIGGAGGQGLGAVNGAGGGSLGGAGPSTGGSDAAASGGLPDSGGLGGAGGTGGGGAGSGGADGRDDALPPCARLGPFDDPEPLTGLGAGALFSPAIIDDHHVLIFASASPAELFSARRPSRGSPDFSDVQSLSVNTADDEVTPWMSGDGLALLFASDRPGALSSRDLMHTTRPALDAAFATPVFLSEVNSTFTDILPSLHSDARVLLFASGRPGGAGRIDLWAASRDGATGPFQNFNPIVELNSGEDDSGAAVTGDALRIYFTSERSGGAGGRDLWFADRVDPGAPFSTPRNLTEINGVADEADPAISADGRELFFSTSRSGGSQIWHSLRICLDP